jgi:CRISPR/Cas system-associated exonuclease Cas4 (RecB family)
MFAGWEAHQALLETLDANAREMRDLGFEPDPAEQAELSSRLSEMLDHYMATAKQLPNLTRLEEMIEVPIPSRGGVRASTKYRFICFLDGYTDDDGMLWLVEFKLRKSLQPLSLVQLSRQLRWYAWALERQGHDTFGVLVDQRLNDVPKPARINAGDKVSHAKDQLTTAELYIEACLTRGEEPRHAVVDHLRSRDWQKRLSIQFRPGELVEAGQELVSAAKLIRDLDSEELFPIRNATRMNCGFCKFKEICPEPTDGLLVDQLFERTVPKRLREKEVVHG